MRMLITCSDARIRADEIVGPDSRDVFVLRNAGNIVPLPGSAASGSEAATIDLAVEALGVEEIIVCGHTDCGAMKALVGHPKSTVARMPSMMAWLKHADGTRRLVDATHGEGDADERLAAAIDANVAVQVEQLKSYPNVARRIAAGQLRISPLVYELETRATRRCRPILPHTEVT